jgi:hypothetical protein
MKHGSLEGSLGDFYSGNHIQSHTKILLAFLFPSAKPDTF